MRILADLDQARLTGLRERILSGLQELARLERDCEYVVIATSNGTSEQAAFVRARICYSGLLNVARERA